MEKKNNTQHLKTLKLVTLVFTVGASFSAVMHIGSHLFLEEWIQSITSMIACYLYQFYKVKNMCIVITDGDGTSRWFKNINHQEIENS